MTHASREDSITGDIITIVEERAAVSARLHAEIARSSVLVVDDDPSQLRAIERVLRASYHTKTATSASDAIRLLEAGHRFDAILCDMWMPGIDGSVFHEAVGRVAPEEAERTIFVTGGGLPSRLEAFLADKPVLRKPWKREQLLEMLDDMLCEDARLPPRTLMPPPP